MEGFRWTAIAGGLFSPSAAPWGERGLAIVGRDPDGNLSLLTRAGAAAAFERRALGPAVARAGGASVPIDWPIALCATRPDELALVARGAEGELVYGTIRGERFAGLECIGSPANPIGGLAIPMGLASAPAACGRVPGQIDVFAIGASGALVHSHFDGNEFTEFESVGGVARAGRADEPLIGAISAAACGARALAVATRGAPGDLLVKWFDGRAWSAFTSLGTPQEPDPIYPAVQCPVPLASAPVLAGGGAARLDAFARGQRGDVLQRRWDGKTWSRFESVGMPQGVNGERIPFTGAGLAATWGRSSLEVVARAADGNLYLLASDANGSFAPAGVRPAD
jgi:hypothetical protein